MYNSSRIKYAIETLKELSKERSELSKQLGALRDRCEFRENVIDSLYDYYDVVSGDYYAVVDGIVKHAESIEVIRDYMAEHYKLLDEQLKKMREILDKPVKTKDKVEKLEKLTSFVFYMRPDDNPSPQGKPQGT